MTKPKTLAISCVFMLLISELTTAAPAPIVPSRQDGEFVLFDAECGPVGPKPMTDLVPLFNSTPYHAFSCRTSVGSKPRSL